MGLTLEEILLSMDSASIVAIEARHACKGEPDLMERIKKAMKASRNHWMVLDEKDQFRGAIAGALLESEGEESDRIERSAKALNRIGALIQAMQAGLPVLKSTKRFGLFTYYRTRNRSRATRASEFRGNWHLAVSGAEIVND